MIAITCDLDRGVMFPASRLCYTEVESKMKAKCNRLKKWMEYLDFGQGNAKDAKG